jgi:hypothetical protein
MIEEIKKCVSNDLELYSLSKEFEQLCFDVIEYYNLQYPQIKIQLEKVIYKYTKTYLDELNLIREGDFVNVFLALESNCKDTYACIDEGGGIHDLDFIIGKISLEPSSDFYENLSYYDWRKSEFDHWSQFHTNILLTILTKIWYELDGHKSGVVMKSNENSTTQQFFFNDYKWNQNLMFFNNTDWMEDVRNYEHKQLSTSELYKQISIKSL